LGNAKRVEIHFFSFLQKGKSDAERKRFVRVSSFGIHLLMKILMNASLQSHKEIVNESIAQTI
jgi:hypothetical protein